MSRVKPSKFEIFLNYKLWLSSVTGEGILEEERYKLLKKIQENGSLRSAASEMKVSYRKAWGDLKKSEELLGYKLVNRQRGGKDGGASQLTEKAIKLLEAYEALHVRLDDAVEKAYDEFKKKTLPPKIK
jgi:molybdate transport system regulatory protein